MPNYALEALRGYQGIDNIYRQDQRDARETEVFDRARTKEDAGMEVARQRGIGLMQSVEQQPEDRSSVAPSFQNIMSQKYGIDPNSQESARAMQKVQPLINDPDSVAEAMVLGDSIESAIRSGKLPDQKSFTRYVNILGAPELAARNGDDKLHRSVNGTYPSPSGQGVMFNFDVTEMETGRKYRAPATVGKGTDANDTVQEFPVKDVLAWFGGSRETLKSLLEAEAKAGLSTTADKYQAYVEKQQGRGEHIQDAVASKRALSGEDDYATDGKRIVTLNDFKNLSPDQQAKFMPLKQQEINMKQEQLGIARSAANKPSELDRKVSQIGIMVKNNELTPEEGKAAMMGIYGIKNKGEMSEYQQTLVEDRRQRAIERDEDRRNDLKKEVIKMKADGGVTEQNVDDINALQEKIDGGRYEKREETVDGGWWSSDKKTVNYVYVPAKGGATAEGIGRPQSDQQGAQGEGGAPSANQKEGGKKESDQKPDPQKVLAGIPEGKPFTQSGKRYQKVDGKVVEITGKESAPQASAQQPSQAQQPAPSQSPQAPSAPSGMDRLAELDKMRGSRGNIVSSAGIGEIAGAAKGAYGAVKDSGALVSDIYQSLVGEPFMNALRSAKTSQEKQAAQFTIDQRYKNGVISKDEYIAAFDIINK